MNDWAREEATLSVTQIIMMMMTAVVVSMSDVSFFGGGGQRKNPQSRICSVVGGGRVLVVGGARKYTGGPGKSVLNHFTGTMSRDAAGSLVQKGFYARSV